MKPGLKPGLNFPDENGNKVRSEDDSFELFELKVEVFSDGKRPMICNHPVGTCFYVSGENLILPQGTTFPIYCLAALLPLLPAKQRPSHAQDWISPDLDVACPDPFCGGLFRIQTLGKKKFYRHRLAATGGKNP